MKQLLANMNLARWILLVSLVLSIVLAFTGWRLHGRRVALQAALETQVPRLAQEIQVDSRRYTHLYEQAEGAGLAGGQKDVATYLRQLASDRDVQIGSLEITPLASSTPAKGIVDEKYTIRPPTKDKGFVRVNLANFMHLIEQRSRRMRVTHVRLEREGNPRDWEYGNDRWKWDIEVTSRHKLDSQ